MKQFNHTDKIFSDKLNNYSAETPMHLWDAIDEKRTWQHKAALLLKRKGGFALGILMLFALSGWMLMQDTSQLVSSFPIHFSGEQSKIAKKVNLVELEQDATIHSENTGVAAEFVSAKTTITETKTPATNQITQKAEPVQIIEQQPIEKPIEIKEAIPEPSEPNVIETKTERPIATLDQLPNLSTSLLAETTQLAIQAKGPDPDCPKFGKRLAGGDFYIDALVSPESYFRTLTSKSVESFPYQQERDATETMKIGASGGLRLSWVSNTGLALRTGIMYSQIAEKFTYKNGNEEHIDITVTRDANGNIISADTAIIFGARHKVTHNRHHLVDIPILIGYEVNTPKWVFTANSGIYLNLSMKSKGDFLSPQFDPVTFSSDETNSYSAFENTVGLSLYGSVSANYKLTDNIHIVIEPQFRYYLNSFTKSDYLLEQKYTSVGCLTGLRFKF